MKRIVLLTATAISCVCLGGQPIVASAAPYNQVAQSGYNNQLQSYQKGKNTKFSYGNGCNVKGKFNKINNCFSGIIIPDISNPDIEIPENNVPENSAPEGNIPEANKPDSSTHAFVQEVVTLVNAERAKEGLSPLTIDVKVQAAAQVRAKECEQRFSHTRPDGTSFSTALKEQNVAYKSAGENIAWGQSSPQEVMNGWMNSSGHRANIMNPNYTSIGVGYYQNANGTNYWCQLFTR